MPIQQDQHGLKTKGGQARQTPNATLNRWPCRYCSRIHCPNSAQHMGRRVPDVERWATTKRCAEVKETVLCTSYRLRWHKTPKMNKNWSLITAHLEMQVGKNTEKSHIRLTQAGRAISCHYSYSKNSSKYDR